MNEENMSQLTFYVVEAEPTVSSPDDVATIPGQDTELQSLSALRRWFRPEAKEVPADKLLESFEKTQAAIDAMIGKLEASEQKGYQLDEFEVSLAVTGEGTVGFVTATAEAGVVLKFKRSAPANTG